MLRITVSKNASAATKYFSEGLSKQDYYSEKNEIKGKWHGSVAKEFGLEGEVTKEQFQRLAANINPITGEKLNVRNSPNRRAGYDFTFSAPKSVSLVYAVTKDKQIINAFDHAVQKAMTAVEQDMQTQQGQGKNKEYINTGNLAYAAFTHFKARPVNGVPDPHLHQHCFAFNTTKHPEKNRMQAGEFSQLHYNRTFYESVFNAQLAKNLQQVGYQVERNERDFEIKNIDRSTIDKYSNRTREVEREAAKRGLQSDRLKDELGAKTRAEKNHGYSDSEIEQRWLGRLDATEKQIILSAKNSDGDSNDLPNRESRRQGAREALDYAFSHELERQSTISEKRLLATAIKQGIGATTPAAIQAEYEQRSDVMAKTDYRTKDKVITTQLALDEEKKLVQSARTGRGNFAPLNADYQPQNPQLTTEQSNAIQHVLTSRDFITSVTGGAGTGKTWSIKEVADGVREAGKSFNAFAPSAAASRGVQREEGFQGAETIASLLQSKKLQEQTKNGVIWLDEGGMVGNKTMNSIIGIAKEQNARLLITGDVKQHNSVERGDALRVLHEYGGVRPALITKIQRQKTTDYKRAVDFISKGDIKQGYEALDKMGAIKEVVDLPSLQKGVANEYLTAVKSKEKVLVVATTHAQGQAATTAIRGTLQSAGLLAKKEKEITVQRDLSFTTAQKGDVANYHTEQSIQFHQNMKGGIKRGQRYDVIGKDEQGNVQLQLAGAAGEKKKTLALPLTQAEKFSVYQKGQIKLAQGDKIRVTANGYTNEKKRLNNGDIMTVQGFDKRGNILAYKGDKPRNVVTLNKDYRNFTHGYYTTSPAAQGKSVNKVILMQSAASGKASSKEQFYVSASRGKLAISVYTDDKQQLLKSVERSSARTTATEIARADGFTNKQKYQRKENILRTSLSKVKGMWQTSKQIIGNINQTIKQNVQTKAPIRFK